MVSTGTTDDGVIATETTNDDLAVIHDPRATKVNPLRITADEIYSCIGPASAVGRAQTFNYSRAVAQHPQIVHTRRPVLDAVSGYPCRQLCREFSTYQNSISNRTRIHTRRRSTCQP